MHITIIIPCFRDALGAMALVDSLARQSLPASATWDAVVVDDGSGEPHTSVIRETLPTHAKLVSLPTNVGRARARNIGAEVARGEALLFLDADCIPAATDLLSCHLSALDHGAVASLGAVSAPRIGFWGQYQNHALELKSMLPKDDNWLRGSSANLMVSRTLFRSIGGFDEGYRGYGFEDRDLLLRLQRHGHLAWTRSAEVVHKDEISLRGVCIKMREAGRLSAPRFRSKHPREYAKTTYAKVDATLFRTGQLVARLGGALMDPALPIAEKWIASDRVPLRMRFFMARLGQAVAYSMGTLESNTVDNAQSAPHP